MGKKTLLNIALLLLVFVVLVLLGELGRWIFIVLLGAIAVRIAVYIVDVYRRYSRNRSSFRREYILKILAWTMGFFFLTGTIIYVIFLPHMEADDGPHDINNVELFLRSMICSLDMFMLDVDSNILDNLSKHAVMKGILMFQASLSFLSTVSLLITLIYSRMKAYYILHRKTRVSDAKNHLYLFFGLDDNSRLLARNIAEHDPKALSVFIDEASLDEENDNDSWENIVNLFTHRHRTFEIADEAHALVAIGSRNFSDIPDSDLAGEDVDVFAIIGLDKVRQFIESLPQHPDGARLDIFFLSDDEDRNIRSLVNLAKDRLILNTAKEKTVKQRIYCHARYNGPNRIVEDLAVRKGLDVDIVDSSHLAVELIKSRPDDQPVRVASLSKEYPASVTAPLECLIVGFGEVGRDAFRYLYEYATFIEVKDGVSEVVRPRITAIDNRMDVLSGLFRANTPAVEYNTDIHKSGSFNLLKVDYGDYEFYEHVLSKERCEKLNYVVLALGDDDRNTALASNIFNRIRRYRTDMSKLIIMVRCVKEEKVDIMKKVAAHFNYGSDGGAHEVIRLFGQPEEIYSYSTIIREDLVRKGKSFFENYMRLRKEDDTWERRRDKLTKVEIKESGEAGYPDLDNLRKLRRQESQDMSNALHAASKVWILKKSLSDDGGWKDFVEKVFNADNSSTLCGSRASLKYPRLSPAENAIMLRLAMLEHARWNAAHEMLGYVDNTDGHKCDERTQRHNCLKQWDELDDESKAASSPKWICDYKAYDFSVVDTSIALTMNDDEDEEFDRPRDN